MLRWCLVLVRKRTEFASKQHCSTVYAWTLLRAVKFPAREYEAVARVLMTRRHRRVKRLTFSQLFFVCSLMSGLGFITPGKAQLPGVNLGATSFLDGLPPPGGPGFYIEEYFQYYNSSRLLDNDGNEIALPTSRRKLETPHLQTWVMLTQLVYQSNRGYSTRKAAGASASRFPSW